jgi:hypothetical protein
MKRKFSVEEGDHLTMLNVFSNFQQVHKLNLMFDHVDNF